MLPLRHATLCRDRPAARPSAATALLPQRRCYHPPARCGAAPLTVVRLLELLHQLRVDLLAPLVPLDGLLVLQARAAAVRGGALKAPPRHRRPPPPKPPQAQPGPIARAPGLPGPPTLAMACSFCEMSAYVLRRVASSRLPSSLATRSLSSSHTATLEAGAASAAKHRCCTARPCSRGRGGRSTGAGGPWRPDGDPRHHLPSAPPAAPRYAACWAPALCLELQPLAWHAVAVEQASG